ncbi:threonine/homoserine efflux transporter RhtA [Planktotalea frisia]|jgi:drug/metabolite transporter (DMT)-like permease|uniref:Aromatic amino acid exporter n=1 Tax=Planktotalea frisia TaxID=696762 RepID=A0A1L9NVS3_9RHOB|nr:DMT family transporter [Planktotalea frisia]OJI93400.1 aromatic amino acid exporter [Planktotalea frisia]PZX35117.1 threonine/homoserine efflux transporter RhtA [Planktotalea frisia]
MKLFGLVALTMTAFAFNSILNRLALSPGDTGPASYAAVRLFSGAVLLALLVTLRTQAWPKITSHSFWSAGTLTLYAIAFSYAYITLPTGAGALILFGGVQVIAFSITLMRGQKIGLFSWLGASLAFGGLCYLLWPDQASDIDPFGSALMVLSALGWTLYTMAGARSSDPLGATTLAFVLAAPVGIIAWFILPDTISTRGVLLAMLSGAVTSGMGYALWYKVLPSLSMPTAAVAQLTVPVIAALGGALLLGELLSLRFVLATGLVLCGVGLTIYGQAQGRAL